MSQMSVKLFGLTKVWEGERHLLETSRCKGSTSVWTLFKKWQQRFVTRCLTTHRISTSKFILW